MADDPAVTPEFTDAVGLGALKAAGGRGASPGKGSHGTPPAAPAPAASVWPPPPTPEPFKQMVRQIDFLTNQMIEMSTGVALQREPDKYMDEVADSVWPVAFVYGAGAERPTKGVLIMYAIASLCGFAILKYSRLKAARTQPPQLTVIE